MNQQSPHQQVQLQYVEATHPCLTVIARVKKSCFVEKWGTPRQGSLVKSSTATIELAENEGLTGDKPSDTPQTVFPIAGNELAIHNGGEDDNEESNRSPSFLSPDIHNRSNLFFDLSADYSHVAIVFVFNLNKVT